MDLISTYKNNNSSHTLLSKNKDENYRTFFCANADLPSG